MKLENILEFLFKVGGSGFKYNFSFEDKIEEDDILFDTTVIDKESFNLIAGSTVDFKKEMIGESCNK